MELNEQNVREILIDGSVGKAVFLYFYMPTPECAQMTETIMAAIPEGSPDLVLASCDVRNPVGQSLAMQIGIQSVPAVVVFRDRQPVDFLQGEELTRGLSDLVARYKPDECTLKMRAAQEALDGDRLQEALDLASAAYSINEKSLEAKFLLAGLCIKTSNLSRAHALLDNPGREEGTMQQYLDLVSALKLAEQAAESPEIKELQQRFAQNPGDAGLRQQLAVALSAAGRKEEALDLLLDGLRADAGAEALRTTYVDILSTMGADKVRSRYRRALYTLLY